MLEGPDTIIQNRKRIEKMTDYRMYRLALKEEAMCVAMGLALSAVAAWLLYKDYWGLLLGIVIWPLCREHYRKEQIVSRKRELLLQFKDAMQCVSIALLSGYSMENAWKEAEKEMRELYGESAYITEEMKQMNRAIEMNQTVEQLLYQFAVRSGCEDIISFAEVFRFAKRSGGNFGKIIQNTIAKICEKIEVEREIETVISGKRMEQKIMNVVPVFLLGYLNLTSEDFLEPLYGNVAGVCVMSLAFGAYIGALLLARRMVDVKI